MEPLSIYGNYEVSVDPKNRMLIPSEIRRRVNPEVHGKDFFLVPGQNGRPWLFPDKYYEHLATQVKPDLLPGDEATEFDRMAFGLTQLVELDAQNRILLPVRTFEWTGLLQKKKFYLVGVRDHVEIYEIEDWQEERKSLMARGKDIFSRARHARQTTP